MPAECGRHVAGLVAGLLVISSVASLAVATIFPASVPTSVHGVLGAAGPLREVATTPGARDGVFEGGGASSAGSTSAVAVPHGPRGLVLPGGTVVQASRATLGSSPSGAPLTYFQANSALANATAGFDGQTWLPISVVGIAVLSPETIPVSNVTNQLCPVTWLGTPEPGLYVPATPQTAGPGTANDYLALLRGTGAAGGMLYAEVANGSASLLFTMASNPDCPGVDYAPLPPDVLDSSQAVALASASGISAAFPTSVAPTREWGIAIDPVVSGPPEWDVIFSNACGGAYVFLVDAFDGQTMPSSSFFPPPGACSFPMTFQETGLASGTEWFVSLTTNYSGSSLNETRYSTESTITFNATNGTHPYFATTAGYSASPGVGEVTVNGTSVVVTVAFTLVAGYYSVTFNESGLSPGALWSVYVPEWGNSGVGSTGPMISFAVPNGTWQFSVSGPGGYSATPASGKVTVDGASVVEDVSFARYVSWAVTFTESGLPAGGGWYWYVSLENSSFGGGASTHSTDQFGLPNGTYQFMILAVLNSTTFPAALAFEPSPANGTFVVNGSNVSVSISFTLRSGYFPVVFHGTGLPAGAAFFLLVASSEGTFGGLSSPLGTATVYTQDGTDSFRVEPGYGLAGSPWSGSVTVDGASVSVPLTFAPAAMYPVMFAERGLTPGTLWGVNLDGLISVSVAGVAGFYLPNGTFGFSVERTGIDVAVPGTGTVVVEGAAVTVTVTFGAPQTVTFEEAGLPARTLAKDGWTVVVDGTMMHGFTDTISFPGMLNGTYPALIMGAAGYAVRTAAVAYGNSSEYGTYRGGALNVSGTTSVMVVFEKARTYTLTFSQKGLPVPRQWCVAVNDYTQCTMKSSLKYANLTGGSGSFWNTTYAYSVVSPLSGQNITQKVGPAVTYGPNGTATLTGSVTVHLTFAYRYAVTFTESGLTAGSWSVTVHGATVTRPYSEPIVFNETNGTYGYKVGAISGYTRSGLPSKATVSGEPTSVAVTFKPKR